MASEDFALIAPSLHAVGMERGSELMERGHAVSGVFFPESGIVSILHRIAGLEDSKLAIIGREGMVGFPVLLGATHAMIAARVQAGTADMLYLDKPALFEALDRSPALHRFLLRFAYDFLVQVMATALTNGRCRLEARLARWLLMCHDRLDGDEVNVTHEFLALMLMAQRTSVTSSLHVLEGQGVIRNSRGVVRITNRAGLEKCAGDAYSRPIVDGMLPEWVNPHLDGTTCSQPRTAAAGQDAGSARKGPADCIDRGRRVFDLHV